MSKNIIVLSSVVILIIGLGIGYQIGSNRAIDNDSHMMEGGNMMKNSDMPDMDHMMMDMNAKLKGKTDDDFDKAFIEEMIVHHQGAVDMANLALKSTKRKEIIDLSKAIIEAQNKEIADMQSWEKAWFTNK